MTVDLSNTSIAQWFPDKDHHRCGYCQDPSGSISYGMYTEQLTVEDYKDLIDRGWRRSGKYCYKPVMDKTCCPQYTIRCEAVKFNLSKSQKKTIKKFNKFLVDGNVNKSSVHDQQSNEDGFSELQGYNKQSTMDFKKSITTTEATSFQIQNESEPGISKTDKDSSPSTCEETVDNKADSAKGSVISSTPNVKNCDKKTLKKGAGADPNKPLCQKAKLLRLERKKEKLLKKGMEVDFISKPNSDMAKSLEQYLNEIPSAAKHKLKLKLIPTSICGEDWEECKDIEFELYKKYQSIIHNDRPEKLNMKSFNRFLVSSPLKPKPFPNGAEGPGYGSFHQQYWIGEKLIAVGVIDILPGCVSSVYFFYDPDYRELTLGTYGALREVQLVQDLHTKIPDLEYYYMGFYIHSCPKMRYKGKLSPSYLLCPETYQWFLISKCLPKLDVEKYYRLNENLEEVDTNICDPKDIENIKVVCEHRLLLVKDYLRIYEVESGDIQNLALMVGKRSVLRIIFWMV